VQRLEPDDLEVERLVVELQQQRERTPMPTSAATGRKSVATTVTPNAICEVRPVRRIVPIAPLRSEPAAA
jgi:hypothetical protein